MWLWYRLYRLTVHKDKRKGSANEPPGSEGPGSSRSGSYYLLLIVIACHRWQWLKSRSDDLS